MPGPQLHLEANDWSVREGKRKVGEALFPQLKPIEFLNERRKLSTAASWESLYQRAPSSRVQTSEVPAEFAAALADVGAVGMTFGGCFAGHGIYVADGNATFILDSYSVQ